jgi:hypothetical protein
MKRREPHLHLDVISQRRIQRDLVQSQSRSSKATLPRSCGLLITNLDTSLCADGRCRVVHFANVNYCYGFEFINV